jgi:hypothetical protein
MNRGDAGLQPVDHSGNSITHSNDIEVQQISQLVLPEAQVAQEPGAVHRHDQLLRLDFDHNQLIDRKVDPISVLNCYAPEPDTNANFVADRMVRHKKIVRFCVPCDSVAITALPLPDSTRKRRSSGARIVTNMTNSATKGL